MGKKAQEKRKALGDAYIGKHGTNKLRGAAKGRHNHKRLAKINEKQTFGSTLTQARQRKRIAAEGKATPARTIPVNKLDGARDGF
jgi:hypothetical protein